MCCSVLEHVAAIASAFSRVLLGVAMYYSLLQCNVVCVVACCSVLQCVAVCCSVLQCVAVCCSVLQCVAVRVHHPRACMCFAFYQTFKKERMDATQCNTMQRIATHCNKLRHAATHCNALQRNAKHCNIQKHNAATQCCNTYQHGIQSDPGNTLLHTATRCNTLQQTAK